MNVFREIAKLFKWKGRPHKDSRGTEEEFWARCRAEIQDGKRADPLSMTASERREATRRVTKGMKWSPAFVKSVTMPMLLRALEGGGTVRDPLSGSEININENPQYAHVGQLSRQYFIDDNRTWKEKPFRFDQPKPIEEDL